MTCYAVDIDSNLLIQLLTQSTSDVRITHISLVALAHHRAQRQRVDHRTAGMAAARSRLGARILAHSAEAGLSTRTVRIDRALRLIVGQRRTRTRRIAAKARRAHASRAMIVHATLGVLAAVARILAALLATGQRVRTLGVDGALGSHAAAERITGVAVETVTGRVVAVVGSALRIAAALDLRACVDTIAIDARIRCRTVAVRTASDLEATGQTVAGVTVAAHAQRSMQLHMALGIRAARVALRARIATLLRDARPVVGAVLVARALRSRLGSGFVALRQALHVRRTVVSARTRTLRPMVDRRAQRVLSASVHTRIAALLCEARPICGAVLVDDALRIGAHRMAGAADATRSVLAAR